MRVLQLTEVATDLAEQLIPFLSDYTVVAVNQSAEAVLIQGSVDEAFTVPVTLATLGVKGATGSIQEVTLEYQYVRAFAYDETAVAHLLSN